MWPMPIVHMGPDRQVLGAMVRGLAGAGVGPLAERGLDEALGLAVGLGRVGPGADMFEPRSRQAARKARALPGRPSTPRQPRRLDRPPPRMRPSECRLRFCQNLKGSSAGAR